MATVREASYDLFRSLGMTTMFGNPGSTELPMLADFPDDFRYVLGLQEAVVVGMADGYAQATGRPALVNLHTTPGVGNAMGAIANAHANRSPLVVTAGQQVRAMMTMQALLTNADAVALPRPLVKWSYEVPRAADVPAALARAYHLAATPPRGPVFVSVPMDDWAAEADAAATAGAQGRTVTYRQHADQAALRALADRLAAARNPALVVGAEVVAGGGWQAAVALAERGRLAVFAAPTEGRASFPEDHPAFRGTLVPAMAGVSAQLAGHDLVLVAGAPVFKYYPYIPGPFLPDGASLVLVTDDPDEAARAVAGDAILGDPAAALRDLAALVPASDRPAPQPRPAPEAADLDASPLSPAAVFSVLADALPPEAVVVNESPSNVLTFQQYFPVRRPGGYYFSSGGGLGFGLAAAVGVQLAEPRRPVVAVVGDGSAQYAITALWTAATYGVPLTVVVLKNREYGILKWFANLEQVKGAPGLDLPGLDHLALAAGYGVPASRPAGAADLADILRRALASDTPHLIEVDLTTAPSLPPTLAQES
jgi:benzoylformate decarboxylase